jgi:hypothetical protein
MGGIAVVLASAPVLVPVLVVSGSGMGGGMGGGPLSVPAVVVVGPPSVSVSVSGGTIGGVVLALLLLLPLSLAPLVVLVGVGVRVSSPLPVPAVSSPVLGTVGTAVLASLPFLSGPQARVPRVAMSRPRRTSAGLLGGGVGVGGALRWVMAASSRRGRAGVKVGHCGP